MQVRFLSHPQNFYPMTRQEANRTILDCLSQAVEANPDLRFTQILHNLKINIPKHMGTLKDLYSEESVATLGRVLNEAYSRTQDTYSGSFEGKPAKFVRYVNKEDKDFFDNLMERLGDLSAEETEYETLMEKDMIQPEEREISIIRTERLPIEPLFSLQDPVDETFEVENTDGDVVDYGTSTEDLSGDPLAGDFK